MGRLPGRLLLVRIMTTKELTRDQIIAGEILQQLGGRQNLVSMTGAHQIFAIENGLQFKYRLCRKHNTARIVLNSLDLYDIEFWKITPKTCKKISEFSNRYADMLVDLFVKETGLNLVLFDKPLMKELKSNLS